MMVMATIPSSLRSCLTTRDLIKNAKIELDFLQVLLPILLLFLSNLALPFITLIFAGRISDDHLAGIGLGSTVYNVIMTAILMGYTSVFDTYGPQVYGSKQRQELGTLFVKCSVQGFIVYLIILGPYLNIAHILDLMKQESLQSDDGGHGTVTLLSPQQIAIEYLRLTCIAGFLDYLIALSSKYLTIQGGGHAKFVYITSLTQVALHTMYSYLMVSVGQLGVNGLAFAAVLGRLSTVMLTVAYCVIRKKQLITPKFSIKIFEDWKPMIKLGSLGSINMLAETGLFEVAGFLAQYDGVTTLSTVVILFQLVCICYSVTIAMSYVTVMRVGEKLAEGDEPGAKTYMKTGIINVIFESAMISILLYFFQDYYVRLFTSKQDVIDMFSSCVWLMMIQIPLDHIQTVVSRGILIAFGMQQFIAVSLSIVSYGVGMPLVFVTVFLTELKAKGIIVGFTTFVGLQLIIVCIRLKFITISDEVEKTQVRVGHVDSALNGDKTKMETFNEQSAELELSKLGVVCDEKGKKTVGHSKEWRFVLLVFLVSTSLCVILSAVSLIKI